MGSPNPNLSCERCLICAARLESHLCWIIECKALWLLHLVSAAGCLNLPLSARFFICRREIKYHRAHRAHHLLLETVLVVLSVLARQHAKLSQELPMMPAFQFARRTARQLLQRFQPQPQPLAQFPVVALVDRCLSALKDAPLILQSSKPV